MNRAALAIVILAHGILAQDASVGQVAAGAPTPKTFQIEAGRHMPLSLVKAVSTRTGAPGDAVYLVTTFPVMVGNRIVIPVGSYVNGTLTESKRAGKVKGRAELRMRIDSIILPNGITRDFRGNLGGVESANGEVMNGEGTVKGNGGKATDARTVATVAGIGGMAGGAAGGLATIGQTSTSSTSNAAIVNTLHRPIVGSGIGVAAGAAIGLTAILLTRGPDVQLAKGTDIEMVLDRSVTFDERELAGLPSPPPGLPERTEQTGLKQR